MLGPEIQRLAPLFLAIVVGIKADAIKDGTDCEKGWHYYNDQCYLMRDEYETFKFAEHTCQLFGSHVAFADSQDALTFLSSLVKKQNMFGWWYGAKFTYGGKPIIYNESKRKFSSPPPWLDVQLPKDKTLSRPSTGCVGLIHDRRVNSVNYIMIDVPCDVTLPYVCRGDPTKVKLPKDDHVVHTSSNDVYWFSSVDDRRSYDDAVKACMAKSMDLLSVRGSVQMKVITDQLNRTQDNRVDPWWIGLQVKNGVYSWSNGIYMDNSIVNWNRDSEKRTYSKKRCRILLTDGTVDDRSCWTAKAPFICKRPLHLAGQFGCPHNWWRAGQSCYLRTSASSKDRVTYNDAERICAKTGSHPITVDTPMEKTWLMQSLFYTDNVKYWTSLNDKKTSGDFVWANGQSPKPNVATFGAGGTLNYRGNCFKLRPKSGILIRSNCEYSASLGCQHPAKRPTDCVTKSWKYFKGNCYYAEGDFEMWAPYRIMLHKCYADVYKKNSNIVVSPLKVDSKNIIDFIAKSVDTTFIWIGLKEKSKGVYVWADGTTADISIFKTNYFIGTDASTSKCAVMAGNGEFLSKSCSTCKCGDVICEKEISYDGGSNNSNSMTLHSLTKILITFWTALTLFKNL